MTEEKLEILPRTNPVCLCPKHGKVAEILNIYVDKDNVHYYCIRCWDEFLGKHLERIELID